MVRKYYEPQSIFLVLNNISVYQTCVPVGTHERIIMTIYITLAMAICGYCIVTLQLKKHVCRTSHMKPAGYYSSCFVRRVLPNLHKNKHPQVVFRQYVRIYDVCYFIHLIKKE